MVLGYAYTSNQLICVLEDYQERLECYCVEDDAFMPRAYGGKGIIEVLKTMRELWRSLCHYFSILRIFGQQLLLSFSD